MKNKKNKYIFSAAIIILILIMLLGIGIMFYPIFAARYTESVQSELHTTYEEIIKEVDTSELDSIKAAAMQYNADLAAGVISPLEYKTNGYFEQLSLPNTDIMCFISIPKIDVYLPVYHGVGDDVLDKGAGHMEQTSLPVGGINTHAVISAHTGMAQYPMFTDLELLEPGDIFQIKVLGEILTYEVSEIQIVLPQEVDATQIRSGEDLVSLVTCTPYGVNTHRLIVQGHRIPTPVEEDVPQIIENSSESDNSQSVWTQQYWKSVKTGAIIALIFIIVFTALYLIYHFSRVRKKTGDHEV